MRKILLIFVLLSCQKEMQISDAIPIQFWPVGDDSHNEKVTGYVESKCYIQEFDCVDAIKIQVNTVDLEVVNNYDLRVEDVNGVEIITEPFVKSYVDRGTTELQISNGTFATNPIGVTVSIFAGSNRSNSVIWAYDALAGTLDCVAVAETDKQNSVYLAINRVDANAAVGWPPDTYIIRIRAKNNSSLSSDALGLSAFGMTNSSGQTSLSSVSTPLTLVNDNTFRNIDLEFTTTQYWPYIAIAATRLGGGGSFEIACYFDSIEIISSVKDKRAVSDLSFTALSLSETFCDQQVRFFIEENGTDAYKSDLIKFSTFIASNPGRGSVLLSYKSNINFAGIVYPGDGEYFNLRIPARFFQQRNQTNQASINLSNSRVINTSMVLRLQQLLKTTLLPDYMHNKIQLILAHAIAGSLLIDGYEWIVEESYDRKNPDDKNPFQFGSIYLTRKNLLVRNVI